MTRNHSGVMARFLALRDRFSGTIQDVASGLSIIAFLAAAIFWLEVWI